MNFNDEAKNWDTERRVKRAKQISDFIKRIININPNNVVLEFGCGTGLITSNFINNVSKIIGYDQSENMLDVFNSKFFDMKDKVIGTDNLIGLDSKVDIVISSMVFHHIIDISQAINDIRNIMNAQGQLIIVDLDLDDGSFHADEIEYKGHNGFDRDWFVNQLELNGFKLIHLGTVLEDIKICDNVLIPYSLFYVYAIKKD